MNKQYELVEGQLKPCFCLGKLRIVGDSIGFRTICNKCGSMSIPFSTLDILKVIVNSMYFE